MTVINSLLLYLSLLSVITHASYKMNYSKYETKTTNEKYTGFEKISNRFVVYTYNNIFNRTDYRRIHQKYWEVGMLWMLPWIRCWTLVILTGVTGRSLLGFSDKEKNNSINFPEFLIDNGEGMIEFLKTTTDDNDINFYEGKSLLTIIAVWRLLWLNRFIELFD